MKTIQTLRSLAEFDATRYAEEGAVVFKGVLNKDALFTRYLDDLAWCACQVLATYGQPTDGDLETLLLRLYRTEKTEVQSLCHLATLPNKLASGGALKYSPGILAIVEKLLGAGAVIGTPAGSDTLHVFVGEPAFDKYILPIHQDYPYLMQSTQGTTLWIPMVPYTKDVGGLNIWPGSHKLGVHKSTKHKSGAFGTVLTEEELTRFEKTTTEWDLGDVVVIDSHLLHQGIPNHTEEHLRVTQLFRYTDLRDPQGIAMRWRSTAYSRKGLDFQEFHPELFVS